MKSILKAAVLGIPLPLCSCAVIPTAVALRKGGAGNGATSSFLISTPESGVDSIAMTYAMMDIPMTIFRPLAAFLSATLAGLMQLLFNPHRLPEEQEKKATSCCKNESPSNLTKKGWVKLMKFAFVDLVDDMAIWLGIGVLIGASIDWIAPSDWFASASGLVGRLTIILIGIPTYICASATTPIAASLILKGISPGSALLFLLVGPATNISNILVMQKYIGKRGVFINIMSIALVALAVSYGVDFIYRHFQLSLDFNISSSHGKEGFAWWQHGAAIALSLLIVKGTFKGAKT